MERTFGDPRVENMAAMSFDAMDDFAFKHDWDHNPAAKGDSDKLVPDNARTELDEQLDKSAP